MTDARERRRQRHESRKGDFDAKGALKKFRVPLIIGLIWLAAVGYNVAVIQGYVGSEDCPGHWHSTMDVFVEDQKVVFTQNPAYTLEGQQMPISRHMHRGSEGLWHFEPNPSQCIPYEDAMDGVDMELRSDALVLEGGYHEAAGWGGTHTTNETHELTLRYKEWQGEWQDVSASRLNDMQVPDGAQVMVAYGNYTEPQLIQLEQQTTAIPGNLEPGGESSAGEYVRIIAFTLLALVAVAVWYSMASKTW